MASQPSYKPAIYVGPLLSGDGASPKLSVAINLAPIYGRFGLEYHQNDDERLTDEFKARIIDEIGIRDIEKALPGYDVRRNNFHHRIECYESSPLALLKTKAAASIASYSLTAGIMCVGAAVGNMLTHARVPRFTACSTMLIGFTLMGIAGMLGGGVNLYADAYRTMSYTFDYDLTPDRVEEIKRNLRALGYEITTKF